MKTQLVCSMIFKVFCFLCYRQPKVSRRHYFSGCPSTAFVRSSGQILLPQYRFSWAGPSNLDKTWSEWPLASNDDLVRFWMSKIKGHGHSWSSSWRSHPRRRCAVEANLLVYIFSENVLCFYSWMHFRKIYSYVMYTYDLFMLNKLNSNL